MSDLRSLKKKYLNAQSTYQFSQSLLNASVSAQGILAQSLRKACSIIEICRMINKTKYSKPTEVVLCGPSEMFSGDFKHIEKEIGDIILGKKIKGLSYDLESLSQSLKSSFSSSIQNCEFRYMNFQNESVCSISFYETLKPLEAWSYDLYIDNNIDNFIEKQMWNYILVVVRYNEQMYRGVAINKFVNNCEKNLIEYRSIYHRARNSEITNQIIGFRKNK